MNFDFERIVLDGNRRITGPDLECLARVCDTVAARTILEIGSADGGSSIVLGTKAKERGGHLYCLEPNPKRRMVENMARHGLDGYYTLIRAASPWLAPDQYMPEVLDLLFIDGAHELRWCLVDYHYWSPRVRPGGAIVFHDTGGRCQEDRRQPDFGRPGYVPLVQRAIDIILTTDPLVEIDRSNSLNGGAIAFRQEVAS